VRGDSLWKKLFGLHRAVIEGVTSATRSRGAPGQRTTECGLSPRRPGCQLSSAPWRRIASFSCQDSPPARLLNSSVGSPPCTARHRIRRPRQPYPHPRLVAAVHRDRAGRRRSLAGNHIGEEVFGPVERKVIVASTHETIAAITAA
jgi:hypothetical protein